MIIYGTKATLVKTESAESVVCSGCLNKGTTEINVFSKHFYLYWIPIFPVGKIGVSHCRNCNHTFEESHMPNDVKKENMSIKQTAKPRIWQFSGLVVIALLILWGTMQSGKTSKLRDQYLQNPAVGDVYETKTETSSYTTLKVVAVQGDSLVLAPNNYETNKMTGIYKIDKNENYSDTTFMTSKAQIKKMYDESTIFDVNRK
jgi:hypothetical protein